MLGLVGTVAAISVVVASTPAAADGGDASLNAQAMRGYWAATAGETNEGPN